MKPFIWTLIAGFILVGWIILFFIHSAKEPAPVLSHSQPTLSDKIISNSETKFRSENIVSEIPFRPGEHEAYYGDQSVSAIWKFHENMEGGTLQAYYRNGQIFMEMIFKNRLPHGNVKYYYPEGSVWIEETFVEGQPAGQVSHYYESGSLWVGYTILNSQIDGLPEIHSESESDTSLPENLSAETQQGYFKVYDANGNLVNAWEGDAQLQNRQVFYMNGKPSAEFKKQNAAAGGPYRFYYPNGDLMREGQFIEGALMGKQRAYYVNGKLWMENQYDDQGVLIKTLAYYPSGAEWFEVQHREEAAPEIPRIQSEIKAEVEP